MATNKTEFKIDMFKRVLPALDTRNKKLYENLSEEERKGFSPWLVQRYLSSAESANNEVIEHYLIMTNDIVNVNFSEIANFGIGKEKNHEMICKLMSIVGIGKSLKHPFIPPSTKRTYENAFKQWLFDNNHNINDQELDILFHSFTKEAAKDLLEQFQVKDKKIIKSTNDL
jgi:hypothetical protein